MSIEAGKDPLIKGQGNLTVWKSSAWAERAFCKTCGSSIYYKVTAAGPLQGNYYFCPGGLDDWKDMKLNKEIYIDQKPAGYCFQTAAQGHTTQTKAEVEAMFEES